MADSDDEGFLLSGRAVTNTARVVRYVQGQSKSPPQAQYQRTSGSVTWHWFINDSSETAPAYAVMEVGTACTTVLSGDDIVQAIYHCTKPTTTFRRRYAINSAQPVAAGDGGWCTFEGPARIAHDTAWSPALGEAGGPKPSSWLLWKGFPGLVQHVDGIWSASDDILLGTLSPVSTLLCKATAALTEGPVSSNYKIWSSTIAAGADSGFTVLPSIELNSDVAINEYFLAHWVNNGWVGGSGLPTLTSITVVTDYRYDSTTHALQKKTRTMDAINAGSESGWTAVATFTGYTVVTEVDTSGTALRKKTRAIYAPEAGTESAATTIDAGTTCP